MAGINLEKATFGYSATGSALPLDDDDDDGY